MGKEAMAFRKCALRCLETSEGSVCGFKRQKRMPRGAVWSEQPSHPGGSKREEGASYHPAYGKVSSCPILAHEEIENE